MTVRVSVRGLTQTMLTVIEYCVAERRLSVWVGYERLSCLALGPGGREVGFGTDEEMVAADRRHGGLAPVGRTLARWLREGLAEYLAWARTEV